MTEYSTKQMFENAIKVLNVDSRRRVGFKWSLEPPKDGVGYPKIVCQYGNEQIFQAVILEGDIVHFEMQTKNPYRRFTNLYKDISQIRVKSDSVIFMAEFFMESFLTGVAVEKVEQNQCRAGEKNA